MEIDFMHLLANPRREQNKQRMMHFGEVLGHVVGDYDYGATNEGVNHFGHYLDDGKLPFHPTFSTESKYHNDKHVGGRFQKNMNNEWIFTPSVYQMKKGKKYTDSLAKYFQREKGRGIDEIEMPAPYSMPDSIRKLQD